MSRCQFLIAALLACEVQAGEATAADQPHAVVVVGTHHDSPQLTMPLFARELERFGFRTTLVTGEGDPEKKAENVLPGIEALAEADVAIFYMRFLKLPDEELRSIAEYVESGKPVIGLRTANHAFKYPQGHPRFEWNDGFGQRVLGTPYVIHQAGETAITTVEKNRSHPIMSGITKTDWTSPGSLYLTRLEGGTLPLAIGTGTGRARLVEKDYGTIQVNEAEADIVAWVWENEWGGRVFATSLGHPGDFARESFTRMLINSACWAVGKPPPGPDERVSTWDVEVVRKKPRERGRNLKGNSSDVPE
jgi:type 1 glutamine amidotransferase